MSATESRVSNSAQQRCHNHCAVVSLTQLTGADSAAIALESVSEREQASKQRHEPPATAGSVEVDCD